MINCIGYKKIIITVVLSYSSSILMAQSASILPQEYQINVVKFLKNNLSSVDYKAKNLDESYFLKFDSGRSYFLRIPFIEKSILTDFIALQTDSFGNCIRGSIVHFNRTKDDNLYTDTLFICNLERKQNKIIYFEPSGDLSKKKITSTNDKTVILDPVVILGSDKTKIYYYFNVLAILNPLNIEPMKEGGFGIAPSGLTR